MKCSRSEKKECTTLDKETNLELAFEKDTGKWVESGALYVVATPIGNLSDISERALAVLREVDFIAAEDTRVSGKLLSLLLPGVKKSIVNYFEHNKGVMGEKVTERLLNGESCAIVTDAGTPAVSDPGEDLVRLAHEKGVKVVPIPGSCAAVTALSASGMPSVRFTFEGFLPRDGKEKKERLEECASEKRTMIFYEAPHRIAKTLAEMKEYFGDRRLFIARELTKLNEELYTTTLSEALSAFESKEPKGEFVLVIEGKKENADDAFWKSMTIEEHVDFYTEKGLSSMDAIKQTAKDRGVAKNQIYKAVMKK